MKKLVITFFALMSTVAGIALGADAKAGAEVFNNKCKMCHGEGGATPNEGMSKMFGVPIPVLTSPEIQAKSEAEIHKIVVEGKGKMPAVLKTAPPAQVDDVVAYVKSLKK
jgi:mono/diheme cytochrome c family protein